MTNELIKCVQYKEREIMMFNEKPSVIIEKYLKINELTMSQNSINRSVQKYNVQYEKTNMLYHYLISTLEPKILERFLLDKEIKLSLYAKFKIDDKYIYRKRPFYLKYKGLKESFLSYLIQSKNRLILKPTLRILYEQNDVTDYVIKTLRELISELGTEKEKQEYDEHINDWAKKLLKETEMYEDAKKLKEKEKGYNREYSKEYRKKLKKKKGKNGENKNKNI